MKLIDLNSVSSNEEFRNVFKEAVLNLIEKAAWDIPTELHFKKLKSRWQYLPFAEFLAIDINEKSTLPCLPELNTNPFFKNFLEQEQEQGCDSNILAIRFTGFRSSEDSHVKFPIYIFIRSKKSAAVLINKKLQIQFGTVLNENYIDYLLRLISIFK